MGAGSAKLFSRRCNGSRWIGGSRVTGKRTRRAVFQDDCMIIPGIG